MGGEMSVRDLGVPALHRSRVNVLGGKQGDAEHDQREDARERPPQHASSHWAHMLSGRTSFKSTRRSGLRLFQATRATFAPAVHLQVEGR
jgi:hypothetical protein